MTDITKPTSLTFTDQEILAAGARKLINEGFYRFIVRKTATKIIERPRWPEDTGVGNYVITMTLVPLRDPEDGKSAVNLPVWQDIGVPKANPEFPDMEVPEFWRAAQFFEALFSMPAYPQKDEEGTWTYDGKVISKTQVEAKKNERSKAILSKIAEVWETPESLNDNVFYAQVYHKNGYPKLRRVSGALPEGESLVAPSDFVAAPVVAEDQVTTKGNGKAAAAKPTKFTARRRS